MEATVTKNSCVTIDSLQEAESLLSSLAAKVRDIQLVDDKYFWDKLADVYKMLIDKKTEEMKTADSHLNALKTERDSLTIQNRVLFNKIAEDINILTKEAVEKITAVNAAEEWVVQRTLLLDGESASLEEKIDQLKSQNNLMLSDLEDKKKEHAYLTTELKVLNKENKRLIQPDKTQEFQKELTNLQKQIEDIHKSAANLCGVKYTHSFDIQKQIDRFKTNLTQITKRLKALSIPLPESTPSPKRKKKKNAVEKSGRQLTDIEITAQKVKDSVLQLQHKLESLQSYAAEAEVVRQLMDNAQLALQGERTRLQKQQDRKSIIDLYAKERKSVKNQLESLEKGLDEIQVKLNNLEVTRKGLLEQKSHYLRQIARIKDAHAGHTANEEKINTLNNRIKNAMPSSEIWAESVKRRTLAVRKEISFGNLLSVFFFFRRAMHRYHLGRFLRREVILTERKLHELGFLTKAYLEQIDIFNRKNKNGEQLCIDILNL